MGTRGVVEAYRSVVVSSPKGDTPSEPWPSSDQPFSSAAELSLARHILECPIMSEVFTPTERALIRSEFMDRYGEALSLHDGIWLRRWVAGANAGKPKLKSAVQSLLDHGLVQIVDPGRGIAKARFTLAGIEALRAMAANRQQLPPDQYGHLIEELQQL
jgi:hypothetical protein